MQVTPNNNSHINFSGATRALRRSYFATAQEVADVFEKHPKSDGIAGSLPHSWLANIVDLPKEQRSETIKKIYTLFRDVFQGAYSTENQMAEISKKFTDALRAMKIIPAENQIIIKKRNLKGSVLKGAYIIQERGKTKTLEPLFVKQFTDNSGTRSANEEGKNVELALGLHLHRLFRSEHILCPYFGDTKAGFMVSKYEITPQNVKIPRKLKIWETFDYQKINKYFTELHTLTGDNTEIQTLLGKKGFYHKDLHDENILVTRNRKGNLILKLIDLGKIVRQKN